MITGNDVQVVSFYAPLNNCTSVHVCAHSKALYESTIITEIKMFSMRLKSIEFKLQSKTK